MTISCSRPERQPIKLSPTKTVRGVDIITNVPMPIEVSSSIYKKGDTVWVHTGTKRIVQITWLKEPDTKFRKFVLQD